MWSEPVTTTEVAFLAVALSVEDPPAVIVDGEAVSVTVGVVAPEGTTVTVAAEDALPPVPLAVAVYVVVAAGLTDLDPPSPVMLKELPSDPLTVTALASVAVTVNIVLPPVAIEAGLAAILTVGVTVDMLLMVEPPQPEKKSAETMQIIANGVEIQLRDRWARALITVSPSNVGERAGLAQYSGFDTYETKQEQCHSFRPLAGRSQNRGALGACRWSFFRGRKQARGSRQVV